MKEQAAIFLSINQNNSPPIYNYTVTKPNQKRPSIFGPNALPGKTLIAEKGNYVVVGVAQKSRLGQQLVGGAGRLRRRRSFGGDRRRSSGRRPGGGGGGAAAGHAGLELGQLGGERRIGAVGVGGEVHQHFLRHPRQHGPRPAGDGGGARFIPATGGGGGAGRVGGANGFNSTQLSPV